ncbi:DUF4160 domain-containing protein [Hymenobacter baengnokdamensis]|uniref:DUF4160 domain-containing protein n=1 Tax=Hymenobacter baengnokdamensis TaxID=2615203 RepID=UPI001243F4BD|nr:DUF4160 domain-containing protein [Hymenobacter baengnokdamensis]
MPTALRLLGFRFFFYSNECSEPPHIHIERADELARFWLDPVELVSSSGFSAKEINQLRKMVVEYQAHLLQA